MDYTLLDRKSSAPLLAALAEESKHKVDTFPKGGISKVGWVQNRIVVVEQYGEEMILHVAAALEGEESDALEQQISEATMRDFGMYEFVLRNLEGCFLMQVSTCGLKDLNQLEIKLQQMFTMLEDLLKTCQ